MSEHSITDDEVFERMRTLIADEGAAWADNYEIFIAENRTFDPCWADGVDAIRDNTVELIVFGRECMIKTGRETPPDLHDANEVLSNLAIAMDHAVSDLVRSKRPSP